MYLFNRLVNHKILQYRLTTKETLDLPTTYGGIKGVKRLTIYDDSYYAFEGIPFAKPPLKELRFRSPQPPEPWQGILDCTNCRNKPLQKHVMLPMIEGSEDCLYLNVYVKQVMEYSHLFHLQNFNSNVFNTILAQNLAAIACNGMVLWWWLSSG